MFITSLHYAITVHADMQNLVPYSSTVLAAAITSTALAAATLALQPATMLRTKKRELNTPGKTSPTLERNFRLIDACFRWSMGIRSPIVPSTRE